MTEIEYHHDTTIIHGLLQYLSILVFNLPLVFDSRRGVFDPILVSGNLRSHIIDHAYVFFSGERGKRKMSARDIMDPN